MMLYVCKRSCFDGLSNEAYRAGDKFKLTNEDVKHYEAANILQYFEKVPSEDEVALSALRASANNLTEKKSAKGINTKNNKPPRA